MRKIFVVTLSLIMAICCFGAIACGNNEDEHVHTYSSEWTSDETHHWKKATCEHADEISEKAEHTFALNSQTGKEQCSVCQKVKGEEGTVGLIPPELMSILTKGFKASGTLKTGENTFSAEFIAALTEGGLFADGLVKLDGGTGVVFLRGDSIYRSEDLVQGLDELSKLKEKLGNIEFDGGPISDMLGMSNFFTKVVTSYADEKIQEFALDLTKGILSYLKTETTDVEGTSNKQTVIDIKATSLDLLSKVKALANYIDTNVSTAKFRDLYNTVAFKDLASPLLSELSGKQVETFMLEIVDIMKFAGGRLPFEIIAGGDEGAYDYLAKYLEVEVEMPVGKVKLGDVALSDIFGGNETGMEEEIDHVIAEMQKCLKTMTLTFVYGADNELLYSANFDMYVISGEQTINQHEVDVDIAAILEYDAHKKLTKAQLDVDLKTGYTDDLSVIDVGGIIERTKIDNGEKITLSADIKQSYGKDVGIDVSVDFALACLQDKGKFDKVTLTGDVYSETDEEDYLDLDCSFDVDYANDKFEKAILDISVVIDKGTEFEAALDVDASLVASYTEGNLTNLAFEIATVEEYEYPEFEFKVNAAMTYTDNKLTKIVLTFGPEELVPADKSMTIDLTYDDNGKLNGISLAVGELFSCSITVNYEADEIKSINCTFKLDNGVDNEIEGDLTIDLLDQTPEFIDETLIKFAGDNGTTYGNM